ncbi:MAG TPA: PadR family transcriptional regulator [Candidatus Saccharimonadales bacterium]|nr:PadR family transcriptional regulator [Candidatus Saccharimonadales bacterium]
MSQDDTFAPLRKGLLELAVLQIVSAHEVYAADILDRLSETDFVTGEGTLYPLLSRMKREGLLEYSWVESVSGPPRKYYQLTAPGRARLKDAQAYLHTLSNTLRELGGHHA